MRVTTQMMQASAKRAGISFGSTSLLNYINGGSTQSTQNALLNALNTTRNSTVTKTQWGSYEKLEESANGLTESLHPFLVVEAENIFVNAPEDDKVLTDAVKQMVDKYNDTMKQLKNTSNPLNDFYKEMLGEAAGENEAELSAIGIIQNKNGTLSLDEDKLKNTDLKNVEKALGSNGTFAAKVAFIASRISDNAKANTESYTSQYRADGYSYVSNASKYDFWG